MRHFEHSEFDQKGLPGSGFKMDRDFLIHLDELRERCGFPFVVSSGYRTPDYNASVSNTGTTGPHTTGKAADILVSGAEAYTLLRYAMSMGVFTGIGIKQIGSDRFIHLDTCEKVDGIARPAVWSY